ncbi:hypothetical protein L6274_04985 [Candidatus Parcubacteria bacterium]|nr:hypothetical protein [Candidatus Parcubacteria bacterium]
MLTPQTTKFIISRVLYLALGVVLVLGAMATYAAWDDARTGGSGELSEDNWNSFVNMLESGL